MKGGIGTYGLQVGAIQVAGLVAVNACGNVVDHESHKMLAGIYDKRHNRLFLLKMFY